MKTPTDALPPVTTPTIRSLADIGREDVSTVGGKAANLGELLHAGVPVPPGFAIAVDAYSQTIAGDAAQAITAALSALDVSDTESLQHTATTVRELVEKASLPDELRAAITHAYAELDAGNALVAVRSSATAEDTADFSFAGMFESFLNVRGEDALIDAVRKCWASTFGARVLFYRVTRGLAAEMPVGVIVQRMVDSEKSGVMFTADPATHDREHIVIEAAWGLGEVVVGGQVTPDHYILDKSSGELINKQIARKEFMLVRDPASGATTKHLLTDDARAIQQVLTSNELEVLANLGKTIEEHYHAPQDIEFAVEADRILITQARPITTLGTTAKPTNDGSALARGLGASPGIRTGTVRVLKSPSDAHKLNEREILVAPMTSPDWVPIMRRAGAIVTDSGGMTSHAAIVARELGLPCVVGARDATRVLRDGQVVSVDGSAGVITSATAKPEMPSPVASKAPSRVAAVGSVVTATRLYVNLADPSRADEIAQRDVDGVGLLRAEFMMLEALERTHPRRFIREGRKDEFVQRMAAQLEKFARAFQPRPVVYRAMDFRSNEFRGLAGGEEFEPQEANPMIGYRGCHRYTKEPELFALELRALQQVRAQYGNVHLMIPFVRTGSEFARCKRLIDASELRPDADFQLWVMAEVPSVVSWIPEYARLGATGVSIGSNDLTQLVLGVDRDSELLAELYDERDRAVLDTIRAIIETSHRHGLTCSICGQAPSVYPGYAEQLVRWGIDSVSVNPDVIEATRIQIARAEQRLVMDAARRCLVEGSADRRM